MLRTCRNVGFLTAAVVFALAACVSGQAPVEPLSISPENVSVAAGSAPIVFSARAAPDAGRLSWALKGPGALSSPSDTAAVFTPPIQVPALTSATVTAVLASGAEASAYVEIRPSETGPDAGPHPDGGGSIDDAVRITPTSAIVYAGTGPTEFTAIVAAGTGSVTWSLIGPGSLSFPRNLVASYTPPVDVPLDTGARLTAQLASPARTARADIQIRRAIGNLALTVEIPSGSRLQPTILVTGRRGFLRAVRTSETLYGLAAGSYQVSAGTELVSGSIVTTAYVARVLGSPASVSPGGTARVTVTYTARQGSGQLWVADWLAARLRAYSGPQLDSSGQVSAAIVIGQAGAFGAALGAAGDLWVAADPFTLERFSAAQLQPSGTPDVRLGSADRGGVLDYISGLAFDAQGNLWVASNAPPEIDLNRRILKFSAATLRTSDPNPAPQVTLRATASWYPIALAFDRVGSLWVVDFTNDRLLKFSAAQLATDGAPVPSCVIANVSPGNPLSFPIDLAIDVEGNLWVANRSDERGGGDLVMYSAIQAQAGGNPNPVVRLARPTLAFARGLAFDASGGLWMAVPGGLASYSHAQLFAGGAPRPHTWVQDPAISTASALVFNPPPTGLPLFR